MDPEPRAALEGLQHPSDPATLCPRQLHVSHQCPCGSLHRPVRLPAVERATQCRTSSHLRWVDAESYRRTAIVYRSAHLPTTARCIGRRPANGHYTAEHAISDVMLVVCAMSVLFRDASRWRLNDCSMKVYLVLNIACSRGNVSHERTA